MKQEKPEKKGSQLKTAPLLFLKKKNCVPGCSRSTHSEMGGKKSKAKKKIEKYRQ
jgi:hypothetical protein